MTWRAVCAPVLPLVARKIRAVWQLSQFDILYPNDALVRLALRGTAAYQFSWFDAHMWAYAEYYGLARLISEDFSHGRLYGTVRVHDPFRQTNPDVLFGSRHCWDSSQPDMEE
jgi:predicted nucleic acid-binding protein